MRSRGVESPKESLMKQSVTVGNVEAAPGTLTTGFLRVGDLSDGYSPLGVPVILLNGVGEGPTVYLHAGSHGQEPFYAIEALRRLSSRAIASRSSPRQPNHRAGGERPRVSGCDARCAAYAAREQRPFGGDLHRGWPGRADGTLTERVQHGIWTRDHWPGGLRDRLSLGELAGARFDVPVYRRRTPTGAERLPGR